MFSFRYVLNIYILFRWASVKHDRHTKRTPHDDSHCKKQTCDLRSGHELERGALDTKADWLTGHQMWRFLDLHSASNGQINQEWLIFFLNVLSTRFRRGLRRRCPCAFFCFSVSATYLARLDCWRKKHWLLFLSLSYMSSTSWLLT
jgi:hypothetical protein